MSDRGHLRLAQLFKQMLGLIGEDSDRGGLRETPLRAAKAWNAWTAGYSQDPASVLKVFEDGAERYDGLVTLGNIPIYSHCEHHLAPFFGVAHIGYIPNGKVVGLSKISRVADIFAKRLQVQERLTRQIADTLQEHLSPLAVGVVLQCRHMCMESRGIQRAGVITTTSALRGLFHSEAPARAEFIKFVELSSK